MEDLFWPFLIPITAIVGGITYSIVKTVAMARVRELEVRERIAMIERGLVPSPETNPHGFERAMNVVQDLDRHEYGRLYRRGPERPRSAGITLMGVGFGLMLLIAFAGEEPGTAIGVGGFLVILGIAFVINSLFCRTGAGRNVLSPPTPSQTAPPSGDDSLQRGS
jgi:hypothetical protein